MTMGPEPRTRTRFRSVRLGIDHGQPRRTRRSPFLHGFEELLEEIVGVVRSGGGFGVVLHGEDRLIRMPESLDRAVVKIQVRDLYVPWQRFGVHGEAVVL